VLLVAGLVAMARSSEEQMRLFGKAGLIGLSLILGTSLSIAPANPASAKGNKAEEKAFKAEEKSERKTFKTEEKAERKAFNATHPTVAQRRAFNAEERTERQTFNRQEKAEKHAFKAAHSGSARSTQISTASGRSSTQMSTGSRTVRGSRSGGHSRG
jgi:hypothetical protein